MKRARGFSLVELMVTIAIAMILLAIGVPTWLTYLENSRLRATAQSFLSGIQAARTEAVRRNANIEFVFSNDSALSANSSDNANGMGWVIRTPDKATFIEGKSLSEGAGRSGVTLDSAGVSVLTFTGLGTTTQAANLRLSFSNPTGGACAPAGPMRCLDIVVTRGGQSKLCDPTVTAPDTRAC